MTQRRPRAGSITCTQSPCTRQTTTKWVSPDGSRTTTIAGSASASGSSRWSTGIITCSASRPRLSASVSSVSIDVPSTDVWQASRRRP